MSFYPGATTYPGASLFPGVQPDSLRLPIQIIQAP